LAVTTEDEDVVFVQVSGGRELLLKPDLSIVGGLHLRGLRDVIGCDMPDILDIAGILDILSIVEAGIMSGDGMTGVGGMDGFSFGSVDACSGSDDADGLSVDIEDMSAAMAESPIASLLCITGIVIQELSSPSPGPNVL